MEVFEEKSRVDRQSSSASTQIRRSSKVKYILSMAGIVLVTMALLVVIHFSREYTFWSKENSNKPPKVSTAQKLERKTCEVPFCNTKECVFIASAMLDSMNPDADPCSDFYNYACGGYSRTKSVPYASDFLSPAKEAQEELLIDIRKVLEKPPSDTEGSAMEKMRIFYDTCMNSTHRNEVENKTLEDWLWNLRIVPHNYTIGDPFDFEPPAPWTELVGHLEWYQIHTLFKPHFVATENTKPDKMELDCVVPFLNLEAYSPNTTDDELAFQLVMYKESMKAALELLPMDRAIRREFAEDVMKIDMDIAKSLSLQEPNSHFTDEQKVIIRRIFESVVGDVVKDMEIVSTCKYNMQSIFSVLNEAPNKRVVRYVMWRMMMQMMQYMGTEFRDLHIHYMTKLPVADYAYESRWKECIDIVRSDLSFIAMRGLMENGYLKKETIDIVNAEFIKMKRTLTELSNAILENIHFSAFATKVLNKLKSMKVNTGFAENITDNKFLDYMYEELEIDDRHFYNMRQIKRLKGQRKRFQMWTTYSDFDAAKQIPLEPSPLGISNSFDYTTNTIHVDLGLLRPPVFVHSTEVPEFLTYAFSSALARGLGHAFDITGSHYDADGQYHEQTYWPRIIEEKYHGFSTCLLNQAANSNDDNYVNDTRILNNIMADMTAFAVPFEGLKAHLKRHASEKPLPGVNLTKKQTFFVQTAQLFCEIRSKPSSDPQSRYLLSPKHRVNLAVSNIEDFGSVFNCPIDSPMNKQNKCEHFKEQEAENQA